MSLTRIASNVGNVSAVLSKHVVFEVECIDRMYLNVYVPGLQYASGPVGYIHRRLNLPIASTAPLAKISDRFNRDVHAFVGTHQILWVDFTKGQRKDDVMHERLAGFTDSQGVVFIGRAQEKTPLFRHRETTKRWDLSVLQAEFSLTQTLDKPVAGRLFFEQVIRDNLDIGRADQVSLVFA